MNRYRIYPADSLKRINDYLLTFVGEIEVKLTDGGAEIYYPETKLTATLVAKKGSLALACPDNDSVTVNLIKNTGVRVYSKSLQAYLPNNPNLLPVDQTNPIFTQFGLKPVFRYRNSLVFFCRDSRGQVHLVNRHLLEYLNSNPAPNAVRDKSFSVVVAKNIGRFIALIDRGLIPLDYYQYSKFINHSGLKLSQADKRFICFQFDEAGQAFVQTNRELTQIPKNYLAVKVNQDVNYLVRQGKLVPQLNVSVFLA